MESNIKITMPIEILNQLALIEAQQAAVLELLTKDLPVNENQALKLKIRRKHLKILDSFSQSGALVLDQKARQTIDSSLESIEKELLQLGSLGKLEE